MSNHHTRPATQDDVFVMEQILIDSFKASYANFMPEQYVREWFDNNEAQRIVRTGLDRTGVVEILGRTVGFVSYLDNTITQLWVEPDYWKQGAGRALIQWVESVYRTKGYATITLYCHEKNAEALAFLKKMRCRRASQFQDNTITGGPMTVYNMLKMVTKLKSK